MVFDLSENELFSQDFDKRLRDDSSKISNVNLILGTFSNLFIELLLVCLCFEPNFSISQRIK